MSGLSALSENDSTLCLLGLTLAGGGGGEGRSRSGADMRDVRNRKGGVRDVPQTRVTRTSQTTATCRGAMRAAPAMRGRACAAHPV